MFFNKNRSESPLRVNKQPAKNKIFHFEFFNEKNSRKSCLFRPQKGKCPLNSCERKLLTVNIIMFSKEYY